jgi:hypothetical protein
MNSGWVWVRMSSMVIPGASSRPDESVGCDIEDAEVGDDAFDDVAAGEWQAASVDDLVGAVLGDVFHEDDDFLGAADEVHRPCPCL